MIITPLQGGEYGVVLSAQGLQPGGVYLIDGLTATSPVITVPFAPSTATSEFTADGQGNGIYSFISATNPQTTYNGLLLLYVPNGQTSNSEVVATGPL
jgi:hypothetical protein